MTARRVVLVLPDPPLPFGNAAARWFWVLVKGLHERGHDVTTFAVYRTDLEREATLSAFPPDVYDVRLFEEPKVRTLAHKWRTWRRPYSYPFSDALCSQLDERLASDFEVLHIEQLWTGWLGWKRADSALLNIHYLYHIDLATRPAAGLKDRVLRSVTNRAERALLRHFPHITALTPPLAERVQEIGQQRRVETVPLALDLRQYPFADHSLNPQEPVVTLIGSFNWYPSLSAGERLLTRLWPDIKRQFPSARLHLVGRNARQALDRWAGSADVSLTENVPDIKPYFTKAHVMVYAPTRASGMKVKVLESFAFGLPVVTTSDGVEGLPAVAGVHAEIAEDDAGLVSGVARLLSNPEHWTAIRREARALVETHCDPERSLVRIERCYDWVTGAHGQ